MILYTPFRHADLERAVALNVAFLAAELDGNAQQKLIALTSDIDDSAYVGAKFTGCAAKSNASPPF
jgi:hypothetical protein